MEAAHAAARAEVTPTIRQSLIWRVSRLELDNLWLVRVQENAPRLRYVELDPSRTFISFPTDPRSRITVGATETPPRGIVRHSSGQTFYERTHGSTNWGILSLPTTEMVEFGVATAGFDITAPRNPLRVRPIAEVIDRFLELHADAVSLSVNSPHLLASEEVRRALKQTMIEAAAKALATGETCPETWKQQTEDVILRRLRRLLEDNPERALYIPEVCAAIGVPERTLRACCVANLGTSPKQYLTLRRLHLARRALLRGDGTVTETATAFGFWHFGRFSQAYRQVHGELPSATFRRPTSR